MGGWALAAAIVAVWIVLELKTSRPDGRLVRTHPYRRMLPYLAPTPNGASVFFDDYVRADELVRYIEHARERGKDVDVTACVLAAVAIGLDEAPKLNRFISGRRLYQRNTRKLAFSALRRPNDRTARVAAIHLTVGDDWVFDDLLEAVNEHIAVERSGRETYTDRELNLFLSLPRALLGIGVPFLKWLDNRNLLPGSFIANDPLYCSLFLANLGSLGMRSGYHHLFDWGNCPLFLTIGHIDKMPAVENGRLVERDTLHMRFSFDERIDDGINANYGLVAVRYALEHPFEMFGCVREDGGDRRPLKGRAAEG